VAISKFNYNSFNVTPVAGKALSFNSDGDGFSTAGASSMTLIKTLTASSDSTLSFVDGSSDVVLDSTYPVYVFKFYNIHPSSNAGANKFQFNMSVDTGSNYNVAKTTTSFVAYHEESDGNTSLTYEPGHDLAQGTGFKDISINVGGGSDEGTSGELYLFNPSSTTFVKHFISRTAVYEYSDRAFDNYSAGYGNTTSAVDAVQFKLSGNNMASGTIKLYGIKDS